VVEDHLDAVDLVVDVLGGDIPCDVARICEGRPVGEPLVGHLHVYPAELERRHTALAGGVPDDLLALGFELGGPPVAGAHDLRVERAGEATVARDQEESHTLHLVVLLEQREVRHALGRLHGPGGHLPQGTCVRPQGLDPLLGPPQPGRRHHLHRARDLLDVLDG
jgi:hypothetical protein